MKRHPLELEFLTIVSGALKEEYDPETMTLGETTICDDGSLQPTLTGIYPGRRVMPGKHEHYWRFNRATLVQLAAHMIRERSRKIRGDDGRGMAA